MAIDIESQFDFSQFIFPLISDGFVRLFSGAVSRVRSTVEWSEWGFDIVYASVKSVRYFRDEYIKDIWSFSG